MCFAHPSSLIYNAKLKELDINTSKNVNCEGWLFPPPINIFVDSAAVTEF